MPKVVGAGLHFATWHLEVGASGRESGLEITPSYTIDAKKRPICLPYSANWPLLIPILDMMAGNTAFSGDLGRENRFG